MNPDAHSKDSAAPRALRGGRIDKGIVGMFFQSHWSKICSIDFSQICSIDFFFFVKLKIVVKLRSLLKWRYRMQLAYGEIMAGSKKQYIHNIYPKGFRKQIKRKNVMKGNSLHDQ